MNKFFMLMCGIVCIVNANHAFGYSTAKLTFKVLDETRNPIKGAMVYVSFMQADDSGIGLKTIRTNDITNSEGLVTFQGAGMESVGATISKDGYYQSGSGFKFTSSSKATNRWEPWNPTVEVVLKKKRNPVPMYVNGGIIQVPKFDEPVGYDLENGDWVSPYGEGKVSDFVFTYHAKMRAYRDYECSFELTFDNDKDGIQEFSFDSNEQSSYKWPFEAPESNYEKKKSRYEVKKPGKNLQTDAKKNVNYIFRVRTKTDNSGKIVEAKYGKLKGEFGFDPKGNIQFHYYFNPDSTRNLEEDPEKNLFN